MKGVGVGKRTDSVYGRTEGRVEGRGRGEARSQLQELPGPLASLIGSRDCLEMRLRPLSLWSDQDAKAGMFSAPISICLSWLSMTTLPSMAQDLLVFRGSLFRPGSSSPLRLL